MRLVLHAPFDTYSGYGNDAVDIAVFLDKAGVDVLPWPKTLLPGLPERFAKLLMKDPRGTKDAVVSFNPPQDLLPWAMRNLGPRVYGWTMWERTPFLPDDLTDAGGWASVDPESPGGVTYVNRAHEGRAFEGLDRLLVTCGMNVDAFRNVDRDTPMDVLPCGIDPGKWRVERRDPQRRMTFLMVGMLGGRKNPFLMLEAWREVKEEHPEFDARLHLHTLAPGLHPKITDAYGPDLTLSERPLSHDELVRMYHDADVLVSTSRGEGNNKPAMEFMATGGTVIAPAWGGHENWMHRDATIPVPFEIVDKKGGYAECEVDKDGLKRALLAAWEDRAATSRRGEVAAGFIRSSLAWPVVIDRLVKTIEGDMQ